MGNQKQSENVYSMFSVTTMKILTWN